MQNNDKLRLGKGKESTNNFRSFMPVSQNARKRLTIYLLLLLFLVIAYLPLSSFLFALKNDALTTNFPNKYFFSAALQEGYLPIWNPYINFGLPLHADPGFAFWNPITWIFGWIGYSVPMLSVEILFYIWLAGIGAYELGISLGHPGRVSFCIGMVYMCCGFFVGNLQHINFLTCAAFLPLVLKTYLDLQSSFSTRKLFFCLVSLYLMATGGHPAIPVASIYFLLLIQAGLIIFNDGGVNKKQVLMHSIWINLILTACFLVLAAPLFYSYYEIYPRFTRAAPVIQASFSDTGFDPGSYLSFLFPFSTTGMSVLFHNDQLMRNGYFSLAGLICFLIALIRKKNARQKIFLLAGSVMLLLSLGGQIKEILYPVLPLLNHIRTNGEFRVFSMLSFILAGSYILTDLMEGDNRKIFHQLLIVIAGISLMVILSWFLFAPSGTIFLKRPGNAPVHFLQLIKGRLDGWTFFDRFFLNAFILIILIGLYFLLLDKINRKILLPLFIMTDLIVFSWTQLPVTGVQMKSPKAIEQYFSGIQAGIPIPKLLPIGQNQFIGEDIQKLLGCWSYYSKQPGTPYLCSYPSRLNQTAAYFNSSLPDSMNKKPFVFTVRNLFRENLGITAFSPSEIDMRAEAGTNDSLILLQNDYFRWHATVNDKPVYIERTALAFMAVPLKEGINEVRFFYDIQPLKLIVMLCLMCWVGFSIFVFRPGKRAKTSC